MKKLIPFLLLLLIFSSCSQKSEEKNSSYTAFYFDSAESSKIISTDVSLSSTETATTIKELFTVLSHPKKKNLLSAIPKPVFLLDSAFENGVCKLTLSPSYNTLRSDELAAFNFAVVSTMSSIPEVETVLFMCEDKLLSFSPDNFISSTPRTYYDTYTASLYYAKKDFSGLVKETKTLSLSPETSLELAVCELLLEDIEDDEISSPFPVGTVINNVYLDGGTCIVDVSPEFVSAASHMSRNAEATVLFSIVNTLTELPKIDNVRFLIEGNPGYGYIYFDISSPLTNSPEFSTK